MLKGARKNPFFLRLSALMTAQIPEMATADAGTALGPGQALQVVVGLGIVLALIAAVAWMTRRLHRFRPQGGGHIHIIEGLSVGAREKLLLVQVDGCRVLLGMCPGRIETLHAYRENEQQPLSFGRAVAEAVSEDTEAAR